MRSNIKKNFLASLFLLISALCFLGILGNMVSRKFEVDEASIHSPSNSAVENEKLDESVAKRDAELQMQMVTLIIGLVSFSGLAFYTFIKKPRTEAST